MIAFENDPEVVLEAVKTDCGAFKFAGDKIKEQFPTILLKISMIKKTTNLKR